MVAAARLQRGQARLPIARLASEEIREQGAGQRCDSGGGVNQPFGGGSTGGQAGTGLPPISRRYANSPAEK
jgi:hypothetical protein